MKPQSKPAPHRPEDQALKAVVDLQRQLFSYAQDLRDLMEQHSRLQRQYQTVLQFHARSGHNQDILVNAIRNGMDQYLVTSDQGEITYASPNTRKTLASSGMDLRFQSILQFTHPCSVDAVRALLDKFSDPDASSAIEQRDLTFFDCTLIPALPFQALVFPVRTVDTIEIYWLLRPLPPAGQGALTTQPNWLALEHCPEGMVMTDAGGRILAINPAFASITGYSADEAVGQNPRMLSSGRQDPAFYRAFWAHLVDDGNWTGEFFNRRKSGQMYTDWKTVKAVRNVQGNTVAYLCAFEDITQRDSEAAELARLAHHDALTGLPNRRLLDDRMTQALALAARNASGLCLMVLDLNGFKLINDKFGHAAGDQVLKIISARMKACLRESDTVARVGGDEFVILMQSPLDDGNAQSIGSSLQQSLSAPMEIDGHEMQVGVSIGCARYPIDGADAATLLKNADAAMYGAKRFGLEFSFYDTGETARVSRDLGFDLWRALDRNEMQLVYQPQVTPDAAQRLRGCEALLRWRHPSLGEISPATFIPIAENNGAIVALGDWVLRTACAQLRYWKDHGLPELTLSVHAASLQLQDPKFPIRLRQILLECGIEASELELEISEAAATQCLQEHPLRQIALRELGVKIAVIDFGVGSSNLTQLRSLQLDRLKINRRFVENLTESDDAQALSQCFVGIGVAMGLGVSAGGVESSEQMEVLAAQGCDLVQGYLTGRPMAADDFLQWARTR